MSEQPIATRDAYGKALVALGKDNPQVVVLDADLSKSTKTAAFAAAFPNRFFNMGIAEANMIGVAAGLATAGKIPFASTFAVFASGRAYDQIRNSIAYPRLNVKIAATHAGITVGEDGASHQALEDIALMRVLPGMTVLVPADARETKAAVYAAARWPGPVYIRLGRLKAQPVFPAGASYAIGQGTVLRPGDDLCLVTTGLMTAGALEASRLLAAQGIGARVLHLGTIKPLDRCQLLEAAETGLVVTVEEHSIIGGLGAAVCELLAAEKPVTVRRLGLPDTFGESGKPEELLEKYGLTPGKIAGACRSFLEGKESD